MTRSFKLPLSPELEALRRRKPGAPQREVITTPREKLSAPPARIKRQSEPQRRHVDGELASTYLNTVGGVFWTAEQHAAADAGMDWDQVDAMVPVDRSPPRPFVRRK